MGKYELKPSDYEWLDRVVKNSTSIENRYQALYELEVSGQKDSDEYKKQMEYLSWALEVEERQYEEAGLNFAKCEALANYILSDRVHDDFLSDNESIAMMDFRDSSLRRIVNNLKSKMYTCYDDIQSELPPGLNDFLRFMGESDPRQKISDDIYASIQIQKAVETDLIVGFLTILKGYIGSEKYKDYRNDLLFFKYYTALINKEIENGMLANQFDVSDSFDCNTEFIAQLIGVVDEVKDFHKNRIGADVSGNQMSSLLTVPDDKYDEKRTVESSILRQCLLRSAFLLMDEEPLEAYHETFHKIIEGDYYLSKFGDDPIGARAIKKCFLAINKDRKKVRGFSIRLGQD